ncbi:MAG: amidohydrolase family protein [Bryobacteraceae bacterium]|nr:amidohydrolase family protein [Bryobacteraceae bacterium]MDW8377721.1 amidohydrolase family protein [Bryobacterales bacterium]
MRLGSFFLTFWLAPDFVQAASSVDWIWSAKYVVTMDAASRMFKNGAVAIRGERIVEVGPRAAIERKYKASRRLDRPESVLLPGLIDAHTHAPMALFRGLADDRRLQDWLENFIFPAEAKNVTPDFVRWGTLLACYEMLLHGTTTYADMYYFEETVAAATKQAGMRAVLGQTIIGFPAPDAKTPQEALLRAEKLLERYRGDPLIVPAVAPHAIYTTPDHVLKAARALANKYGAPMLIHLSETKRENDDALQKRRLTPTALLDSLGALTGRTLAAHAVWLEDSDLEILRSRATGLAHCPSSNAKLASGVARVPAILKAGIAMGLGTDGFAGSNNDANLFEEMDLAAKLQKVHLLDPEALPAKTVLEMATRTGARALGLENETGSLEAGKRADLIILSLQSSRAVPLYHLISQIVYSLKGGDVTDVMVNGQLVVQSQKVLTLDRAQIFAKAREYRDRIVRSLGLSPSPIE